MKKLMIIAAIMALLGLVSCEKLSNNAIVGTWEATTLAYDMGGMNLSFDLDEVGIEMTMTFKKNGTGEMYMYAEGESENDTFEYTTDGNMLYLTSYGETEAIPYSINKDIMTMTVSGDLLDEEGDVKLTFKKK